MAIETAPMGGANRRPAARYQALSSGRPQDPTLQEQAAAIAKKKAMEKGSEIATPYLDGLFTSGVDKVKGFFNPVSTPAVTQAAPLAEGAVTQAAAGTGAMSGLGAAVPYIGAAMLAGKAFGLFNKGGYVNGPLHAAGGGPTTGARVDSEGNPFNAASMYRDSQKNQEGYSLDLIKNIMQKYGVNAYEAAKLLSEGAGSTLNKYKDTILMDEVFDGPARSIGSAIDKRTLDPNQIFSSAFSSLYNQGGYVNGPLSKVRYKQSGGPVNEEIEVSYGGPLSKGV